MNLIFSEFIKGINEGLVKVSEETSMFDIQGSIFPNITSQSKWQFAKTTDHLHLNDGSKVYCFHLPEGEKEHDFPISKVEDVSLHEFGNDAVNKGTVQVHRADPGSIYFTMQDGHKNPTYTFKHISGAQWRAIPKVKKIANPDAFTKGASDVLNEHGITGSILDTILKSVDTVGRAGVRGTMALGHDPVMSAGAGLLGGAAYDFGKRSLYNSKEENDAESTTDRLKRYILPSAAMGLTGAAAKATFPNYYDEYPLHTP